MGARKKAIDDMNVIFLQSPARERPPAPPATAPAAAEAAPQTAAEVAPQTAATIPIPPEFAVCKDFGAQTDIHILEYVNVQCTIKVEVEAAQQRATGTGASFTAAAALQQRKGGKKKKVKLQAQLKISVCGKEYNLTNDKVYHSGLADAYDGRGSNGVEDMIDNDGHIKGPTINVNDAALTLATSDPCNIGIVGSKVELQDSQWHSMNADSAGEAADLPGVEAEATDDEMIGKLVIG